MALAEFSGDAQDVGGFGAGGEGAQIGLLDSRTVGHGIGEWHAEFNDVGAAFDQRVK